MQENFQQIVKLINCTSKCDQCVTLLTTYRSNLTIVNVTASKSLISSSACPSNRAHFANIERSKYAEIASVSIFAPTDTRRFERSDPACRQAKGEGGRRTRVRQNAAPCTAAHTGNLLINSVGTVNNAATMSIMRPPPIAGGCN